MIKKDKLSLTFNIFIVIFELIGFYVAIKEGFNLFLYYTLDSNLLTLISSLLFVIFMLINKNKEDIPVIVNVLRFISTCCLMLTLLVVITILSTTMAASYTEGLINFLFKNSFLLHHFICPILSLLSFVIFEKDPRLNKEKMMYYPLIPTFIYGIILIILNITNVVIGPYPFLMNNQIWYMRIIWLAVIFSLNYLVARFVLLFNQKHISQQ